MLGIPVVTQQETPRSARHASSGIRKDVRDTYAFDLGCSWSSLFESVGRFAVEPLAELELGLGFAQRLARHSRNEDVDGGEDENEPHRGIELGTVERFRESIPAIPLGTTSRVSVCSRMCWVCVLLQ